MYGNCSLRNEVHLYRQCSHLAYQNPNNNSSCLEQKTYCESQNILGRDKVVEQQRLELEIEGWRSDTTSKSAPQRITELERQLDIVLAWP